MRLLKLPPAGISITEGLDTPDLREAVSVLDELR
jgi:hypothetical protein